MTDAHLKLMLENQRIGLVALAQLLRPAHPLLAGRLEERVALTMGAIERLADPSQAR